MQTVEEFVPNVTSRTCDMMEAIWYTYSYSLWQYFSISIALYNIHQVCRVGFCQAAVPIYVFFALPSRQDKKPHM